MATFNIKVRLDTSGVRQEIRGVQDALNSVEQRSARNTRRAATSLNSATTAFTKFGNAARQRSGMAVTALRGIVKRLEQIDRLITRVSPRFNNLLNAGGSTGRGASHLQQLTQAFSGLSKATAAAERRITRLERQMGKSREQAIKSSQSIRMLNQRVRQMGTTAARSGATTERALRRVQRRTEATQLSASRLATTIRLLFGSFAGGLGVVSTGRLLAGFEQSLSSVLAITKATELQMVRLREEAKRLGATTRFTAEQAAQGMVFLARSGLDAEEALAAIEPTLRLAQAGAIDLARAAEISTNIMVAFGLSVSDLPRVIDVMAATATSANTDIAQLGEAMKFVGPVARALGVDVETSSAAIAVLSNAGLQASLAGTGLRQVLLKLVRQTGPASKTLASLGLTARDVDVRFHGLIGVLENFAKVNITAGEAAQFFENRGGTAFLALLNGLPALKLYVEALRRAEGASREMARIMDDNLNGAFLRLKSAAQAVVLELGDAGATAGLRDLVENVAEGFRALARHADTVLDILKIVAAFLATRFAGSLLKGITLVGRFLTGLGRIHPVARIASAVAAATTGVIAFADEIVIARKEIAGLGEVEITLADRFAPVWERVKDLAKDAFDFIIKEAKALDERLVRVFAPRYAVPSDLLDREAAYQRFVGLTTRTRTGEGQPALVRHLADAGPTGNVGGAGLNRLISQSGRRSVSTTQRIGSLTDLVLASIDVTPEAQQRAINRRLNEISLRDAQKFLEFRDRRLAAIKAEAEAVKELFGVNSRYNQQQLQTIASLVQENKLLQTRTNLRRGQARLNAALAQAGLDADDVRSSFEQLRVETNRVRNGWRGAFSELEKAQNTITESNYNNLVSIEREIALQEHIRTGIDVRKAWQDVLLEGQKIGLKGIALSRIEAEQIANRIGLAEEARDAFIALYSIELESNRLKSQEQEVYDHIRGPQELYNQRLAAADRLLAQGRITRDEYVTFLEDLVEQLRRADPEYRAMQAEIKALDRLFEQITNANREKRIDRLRTLFEQGRISLDLYNEELLKLEQRTNDATARQNKFGESLSESRDILREMANEILLQSPLETLAGINAPLSTGLTGEFGRSGSGAGFGTGFQERIAQDLESLRSFAVEAGDIFAGIALNLGNTIGRQIQQLLIGATTLGEAFLNIANTIVNQLINAFVQLGIRMLLNALLGQKILAVTSAAAKAQAAAMTAIWYPPALLSAIATGGGSVATGTTALNTAIAAGTVLNTAASAAGGALGGGAGGSAFAFQNGGLVRGPGGPRDDRILARISNGEFVVNARATRENRQDLEDINAGRGRQPTIGSVNINVSGVTDADSFRRSERQITDRTARNLARALERG